MSLIAYLCWLLGISTPTECNDPTSYEQWLTGSCASTEEGSVDAPQEQGQQPRAPRHSRGTNISVSI